jgi:dihydroflavonol-4-reductase
MILVTGATGLVGEHLLKELAKTGTPVRALYRSSHPDISTSIEWFQADILDVVALENAMIGVTHVYHCAAIVSFNPKKKEELYKTNVEGTANVVNAALDADVEKFLFVSSVAALGRIRQDGKPVNETMQWSKETSNSEYGRTKYLAEMEVFRGIGEGLRAVIVNPVVILGGSDWTKGSTEIFKSVYDEFPWYTEGISGFVDVNDVVKAMMLLMNSDIEAEKFVLSSENISFRDLFTMIAHAFNKKPPHRKVTPFIAEVVWRLEAVKGVLTGKDPLLTKETAKTAQAKVYFDNSKLLQQFPEFTYTPLKESVERIAGELKAKYNL